MVLDTVSHSQILAYETALAANNTNTDVVIPMGMKQGEFTTLVWDNIDFAEETRTDSGTSPYG